MHELPGITFILEDLTFNKFLSDKQISLVLKGDHGLTYAAETIKKTRARLGIVKKDLHERRRLLQGEWKRLTAEEMQKAGLENYGRKLLWTHLRRHYPEIRLGQRALLNVMREIDPEGVARRHRDVKRERGQYIVQGPNYIWSIDGHCKLDRWGFEIYGAIDAYSRYMVFSHCGYTAKTGYAVLALYLRRLRQTNVRPMIIRSDKGIETMMLANLHHALALVDHPSIPFKSCYFYGKSTSNQRIESWWQQWTRSKGNYWKDYFRALEAEGLWASDSVVDRVCMLAVFMPIMQSEFNEFVETWNLHTIRKQRLRDGVVAGKPWMNYHHPQASGDVDGFNHGMQVDQGGLDELQEVVDRGPGMFYHCMKYSKLIW